MGTACRPAETAGFPLVRSDLKPIDHDMEFDVHITETLLRRVALRRLLRRWPLLLLAVGLISVGVWLEVKEGRLGALSVFGLTVVGFLVLMYGVFYIRMRGSIADWKRLQGEAPVHYHLTEDTLRARSNLGGTELRWSVFRELLEHPDFLLLGMGRSGHLTLPRNEVPAEALAFIRERFASHGLPTKKA